MATLPNQPGIYAIRNLINGHIYIGSAVNIRLRRHRHMRELRNNNHHSPHLQRSYNLHGENAFIFEVLEIVPDKQKLLEREQHFLDTLKPEYNVLRTAGSMLGHKLSEETMKKLIGRKQPPEAIKKSAEAKRGKKRPPEVIEKMRLAGKKSRNLERLAQLRANRKIIGMQGKNHSEEAKRKMSEGHKGKPSHMKGKTHTPEARLKMSQALKGKPSHNKGKAMSEELKAKLIAANTGKPSPMRGIPRSEETKRKMSEALKGRTPHNKGETSPFKGIPRSEEVKKKMSETKRARSAARKALKAQQPQLPMLDASPVAPIDITEYTQLSLWDEEVS